METQHQFKFGDPVYQLDKEGDVVYVGTYRRESPKHAGHSIIALRVNEAFSMEVIIANEEMLTKPVCS